jgi:D-alanine-D-alanine ligase
MVPRTMSQPTGNRRLRVAVCFGGPSVEHDVSIISGQQLMSVLEERHEPVPVYLGRDGRWWTGDALRDVGAFGPDEPAGGEPCELRLGTAGSAFVSPGGGRLKRDREIVADVVICAIHGTGGEDGTLLGALEHAGLPYVGGGVAAAAVAMDKALAKLVIGAAGIDVNPHALVTREEFTADSAAATARAAETAGLPCYAKPISLGSSIGVSHCADAGELEEALELCFELDRRALVEPALDDAIEVNAAVLGRPGGELRVSTLEQPVKGEGAALSFEDKYLRGGKGGEGAKGGGGAKEGGEPGGMASQDRLIPAPIPDSLTERISDAARRAHEALGFAGVVRYDFLVEDPEGQSPRVVLNEPNTVPGSFAFYLFEPSGLPFIELADALIEIAFAEAAERRATTRTFESVLLAQHRGGGS